MFCSVCKINLNSSLQADAHYAGKSHKYKAKSTASEVSASFANSAFFENGVFLVANTKLLMKLRSHSFSIR